MSEKDELGFVRVENYIQYLKEKDGSAKANPFNWPMDSYRANIDTDTDKKRVIATVLGNEKTRSIDIVFWPDAIMVYDAETGEALHIVDPIRK